MIYLNSNLQFKIEGKFDAMSALQSILRQSQSAGSSHAIRPNEIVFNMRKIGGHFCHGRQECAHEFTRLFMDAMLRSVSAGHVSSNHFVLLLITIKRAS